MPQSLKSSGDGSSICGFVMRASPAGTMGRFAGFALCFDDDSNMTVHRRGRGRKSSAMMRWSCGSAMASGWPSRSIPGCGFCPMRWQGWGSRMPNRGGRQLYRQAAGAEWCGGARCGPAGGGGPSADRRGQSHGLARTRSGRYGCDRRAWPDFRGRPTGFRPLAPALGGGAAAGSAAGPAALSAQL